MDFKQKVEEIKRAISSDAVRSRIESDLGLVEKNKMYVCFLHSDSSKSPNMSYDANKKDFHCFRCGGHYNMIDHYMDYYGLGFADAAQKIVDDFNLNIDLGLKKEPPKAPPVKHMAPTNKVMGYIQLRGISEHTVNHMGLKMDGNNVVFEYYDQYGTHEANKYRPAKKMANGEKNKYFWKGDSNSLYNMHNIDVTKSLVICEGEFDCIALVEAGFKNVVSPKSGAKSQDWIDKNWDWLQQFDEITLWFDNDNAGLEGVKTVSTRLDNCTKIVYCTIAKDINEVLVRFGKEEVIKQLDSAVDVEVNGVLTASQIENFNVYEAEKIKSGIRLIDANILGYVNGSLVVITGYNGSGKSTLINQMCIAEPLSQGHKVFCFSGELTPSNFKFWLYSTIADSEDLIESTSFTGNKYYKINPVMEHQITEWIDDKLFLYNKADCTQESLLSVMDQLAKRKGVKVFVIDNLMKIELEPKEKNELVAQKKLVNALKMFAIKYNAVVHLVAHPRKPQDGKRLDKFDVSGSSDITNLADYVIGVHRATREEKEQYEAQQARANANTLPNPRDASITLFKDRPTGSSEKEASLYFDKVRKRFYLSESDLNKHYGYKDSTTQSTIDEQFPF